MYFIFKVEVVVLTREDLVAVDAPNSHYLIRSSRLYKSCCKRILFLYF